MVQIQYRQHATWQGKVLWAEKNETKQFRSALELLKLIDSALDEETEAPKKNVEWKKDQKETETES